MNINVKNIKINRLEEVERFIGKPVYAKGYCWNRVFDGWTVIYCYENGDLAFDYRGDSYPVAGFLPNDFTKGYKHNAFYTYDYSERKVNCNGCDYHDGYNCVCMTRCPNKH